MSKFKDWLSKSKYASEDTIAGDITQDILNDKAFPKVEDAESIIRYVKFKMTYANNSENFKEFDKIIKSYIRYLNNN